MPGITAGVGGLAYAGIPATHRDTNHSVIFLTGHDATGKMPANVNWQAVATASPVIVMYMAVKNLGEIASALMEGGGRPDDPVTIISNASLPHQQVQRNHAGPGRRLCCAPTIRQPRPSSSSATPPTGATCSTGTRARCGRTRLAKAFVVAAPSSGSGKTLVTLGLLRALRNRGLRVASAKVGPDYIDPRFHEAATGRPCFNLDPWAMSGDVVASLLTDLGHDADLVIIEGVMGLFDGPQGAKGSTADLAADLGCRSSSSSMPAIRANPSPPLPRLCQLSQGLAVAGRHPEPRRQRPARGNPARRCARGDSRPRPGAA